MVILDIRSTIDLPVELLLKSFQEFLSLVNVLPGPPKISMMGVFCIADIEVKVCLVLEFEVQFQLHLPMQLQE